MTLGDAVRVRVKRADLQKRQLDFELLLPEGAARHAASAAGKGTSDRRSDKESTSRGAGKRSSGHKSSAGRRASRRRP